MAEGNAFWLSSLALFKAGGVLITAKPVGDTITAKCAREKERRATESVENVFIVGKAVLALRAALCALVNAFQPLFCNL